MEIRTLLGTEVVPCQVTGSPYFTTCTAQQIANLAATTTQAANTILGNATAGPASPIALAIGSCSAAGSALKWTTNAGFGCNTSITAAAITSGVTTCIGCAANSIIGNVGATIIGDVGLTYAGNGGQLQLNQFGILTSPAPATWQFGALDTASPVAQTLRFQGVASGTLNTAGALSTIKLSPSTGTGAAGGLSIQATPAGGSGTAQNTYVSILDYGNTVPGSWTFGATVLGAAAAGGAASAFVANSLTPSYAWVSTGGGADQKIWDAVAIGINLTMRAVNDASSTANNWLVVNRGAGTAISNVTFPTNVSLTGLPTSAGGGGLTVCVDTAGVLYKKASCP